MALFKMIISALLALIFFVPGTGSIVGDEEDSEIQTPVYGDSSDESEFVEDDFNGDEFKFLHYGSTAMDYYDEYIWSESFDGGVIGDAVMERNQLVEDKYNVVITAEECGPMGEATKRMQAGQCDFEVIYEWGSRLKSAALDGMLYDLNDLDINLENSWWVPSANENLNVADRLFIFTNMVTMNSISWADMYYFNKNICDELNYEYPYEYVNNNTWTYDVVLEMCLGAEEDLNGDGKMGVEDQFGGISGDTIIGGVCDAPLVDENADGSYTVVPYTEEMVAAYNQYVNKASGLTSFTYVDVWDAGIDMSNFDSRFAAARFYLFGEDHQLFLPGSLDMTKEFVNMKSDYGIVPCPVKDSGDEFSCGIDYTAPMFSMPIQLEDPEMAATVFDYMAYESENLLLPAFYETTIKTMRTEDVRDYEMLDIIVDSVEYNWTDLYMWDSELGMMRSEMFNEGNFASTAKRYKAKCQAEVDGIIETLTSLG